MPPELELMIDGAGRSQRLVFNGSLRADLGKRERKDVGSTTPHVGVERGGKGRGKCYQNKIVTIIITSEYSDQIYD